MTLRFCLDCNTHHERGTTCKVRERTRRRHRSKAERRRRSAVVAEHIAQHGYVCPGYGVPSHPSTDLTADHITPVSRGGSEEGGPLRVLCRSCNSRRGAGATRKENTRPPSPRLPRNKLSAVAPRPRFSRRTLTNVPDDDELPFLG